MSEQENNERYRKQKEAAEAREYDKRFETQNKRIQELVEQKNILSFAVRLALRELVQGGDVRRAVEVLERAEARTRNPADQIDNLAEGLEALFQERDNAKE